MELTGKRIKLKTSDETDEALYIELAMEPDMMTYVNDTQTFEQAKAAFAERMRTWDIQGQGWYSLSINDLQSAEKLGNIALKVVDPKAKSAEVGFMVKPAAQGKGYASEALALIKALSFDTLGLNKLIAYCTDDNAGSGKVLEKAGFRREGHLKQNAVINGRYVDDYLYGLCKSDR